MRTWILIGALSSVVVFAAQAKNEPSNFIFFITDDISHDDISVYGNEFVRTPSLEAMA